MRLYQRTISPNELLIPSPIPFKQTADLSQGYSRSYARSTVIKQTFYQGDYLQGYILSSANECSFFMALAMWRIGWCRDLNPKCTIDVYLNSAINSTYGFGWFFVSTLARLELPTVVTRTIPPSVLLLPERACHR